MHRLRELSRALCWKPRGILAAPNADLSHNHKVWVVGVKRFANDLISDVRAIKIAGVDMVDARFHRPRSEEHTSELQSLMRNSYAVFCLKKKTYFTQCRSENE